VSYGAEIESNLQPQVNGGVADGFRALFTCVSKVIRIALALHFYTTLPSHYFDFGF